MPDAQLGEQFSNRFAFPARKYSKRDTLVSSVAQRASDLRMETHSSFIRSKLCFIVRPDLRKNA
jgi:hypothetical protein